MAKVLTAHVGEHPTSSAGTWILLTVSVAVLTMMAVSVPHLIGETGWATGEKFLYLALLGYLGASVLYVFSLAVRQSNLMAGAEALTRGSLLLHTGAIAARWVTSGHAPLSSIYEMVLVFSWAVVVLHEVAERKFEVRFLGAITLPVATLALLLLQVLPGEIRPLVPALQSTWLQIHVTLAMLSYAGFTISFALALLFLIKDGVSARAFLTWTSGLVGAIYGAIVVSSVDGKLAFLLPAWDAEAQEKVMLAPKQALMVSIPVLGWPFVIVLGLAAATLVINFLDSDGEKAGRWGDRARRLFLASIFAQALALALLLIKVHSGPYLVPQVGQSFGVHLAASPFLLAGTVCALFASLAWEVLNWKYDTIANFLAATGYSGRLDLQNRCRLLPSAYPHDHRRSLLGEPDLGNLLELGPKGRLGAHHLADLRGLYTHAADARLARAPLRLLRDYRVRYRDVYVLRRHLPLTRVARLRIGELP